MGSGPRLTTARSAGLGRRLTFPGSSRLLRWGVLRTDGAGKEETMSLFNAFRGGGMADMLNLLLSFAVDVPGLVAFCKAHPSPPTR